MKTQKRFTELFFFFHLIIEFGGLLGVLGLFFETHGKKISRNRNTKWKDLKGPRAL